MATKLTLSSVTLCLCFWVVTNAHAETRPSYGAKVVASLLEEPLEIDPTIAKTHTDLMLVGLLFDTLYRKVGDEIVPSMAKTMPDATNPLKVRVMMRKGIRDHDDKRLRTRDVVASLERLRTSESRHLLANVGRIEGKAGELVFHLKTPDPLFAHRLADVHASILPRGRPSSWRRVVGLGPFRVKERSAQRRELRLVAHHKHFAGRSYIAELILRWHEDQTTEARLYETGGSQVSLRGDIAFASHRPKYRTLRFESDATILAYVGFGKAQPIDLERDFRHAVSAALGRKGMKLVGSGEKIVPAISVLPKPTRNIPRLALRANPKRAKQFLSALSLKYSTVAGSSAATRLALELVVNKSRPDDIDIAGRVAAALFVHGIKTRVVPLSASAFSRRVSTGQCDLYIGQLAPSSTFVRSTILNAFVVAGQSKRIEGHEQDTQAQLESLFANELPIVPLFHRSLRVHHQHNFLSITLAPDLRLRFGEAFVFGPLEKN